MTDAADVPPRRLRAVLYVLADDKEAAQKTAGELARRVGALGYDARTYYWDRKEGPPWPRWEALLAGAKEGKFEAVGVWQLRSFSPSHLGALRKAANLHALGVHVVSVKEPWFDAESPYVAFVLEGERLRHERAARTRDEKRRRGERVGQLPYGRGLWHDGVSTYSNAERLLVARIRSLAKEGVGQRAIARVLEREGYRTRVGTPMQHRQVGRILKRLRG